MGDEVIEVEGGRPKGYVPLGNNASVQPLPPDFEKYRDPPPTATDVPIYQPFQSPTVIAAEEGTVRAKQVQERREREKEPVTAIKSKATTATDKSDRADRVAALFASVEKAKKEAIANPSSKGAKAAINLAEEYDEYKDNFQEKIKKLAKKRDYPLVSYEKGQKENEENVEQYATDISVYMPSTRKAFYRFIEDSYAKEFTLPREIKDPDPDACEALMKAGPGSVEPFRYQRFIKEYIRQSSPYRGILVYHGLGSGKTCSSIAAAEALYGIANKRIIVMTPQSLRDNFIKEISFCGLRHFSLQNHWTKIALLERTYDEEDGKIYNRPKPLYEIYGRSILSLSAEYIKRIKATAIADREPNSDGEYTNAYIWVPDFNKDPNFDLPPNEGGLTPVDKELVKAQLNETINNRFHFINYNGITNAQLKKMSCEGGVFDNSVIVIDEIHNLSRLMRGKIEPFLFARSKKSRSIPKESVTHKRWEPTLCQPGRKGSYSRGYMFYRLLTDAKNSKIVGLSGTPIINFPEELGILANVLAGYIDCVKLEIETVDPEVVAQFEFIANQDPRVDFVRIEVGGGSYNALLSVFQEGYLKVMSEEEDEEGEEPKEEKLDPQFIGVKHSNRSKAQKGIEEVTARIIDKCAEIGLTVKNPEYVSYPRLPPDQDSFRDEFIDAIDMKIKPENELVLKKRLTGLISYYKGAKPDFLPTITKDEVVKCDFSTFSLKKYVEQRVIEITKEANKEVVDKQESLFAAVEVYAKTASPSSYRFRSRACCNFCFPYDRPYPKSKGEETEETEDIDNLDEDDLDNDITEEEEVNRKKLKRRIQEEEGEVDQELEEEVVTKSRRKKGGAESNEEEEEVDEEEVEEEESINSSPEVVGEVKAVSKGYAQQKIDIMARLNKDRDIYLKMEPEDQLRKYSTKLFEILTRMEKNPGPSLVYSTFEELEGLGVLAAALKANGYDEVKFTGKWFGPEPELTEDSKRSLRKGPTFNKRFVAFTGKVDRRQRRTILAMFNNQWRDVPRGIMRFLRKECNFNPEKKYLHGEMFRCIGITGAGAEGISLRNVRQVHIMEPFWNLVRTEQVKGRAIRICSHMDLPPEERTVEIYTYISSFSDDQIARRDEEGGVPLTIQYNDGDIDPETRRERIMTSDEKVYNVAVRKEAISQKLLTLMKEVAVDCTLNAADNEPLRCLKVDGRADQYMFDPDLSKDQITTAGEFGASAAVVTVKTEIEPVQKATQAQKISIKNRAGEKITVLLGDVNEATKVALLYKSEDISRTTAIGQIRKTPGTKSGWGDLELYKLSE